MFYTRNRFAFNHTNKQLYCIPVFVKLIIFTIQKLMFVFQYLLCHALHCLPYLVNTFIYPSETLFFSLFLYKEFCLKQIKALYSKKIVLFADIFHCKKYFSLTESKCNKSCKLETLNPQYSTLYKIFCKENWSIFLCYIWFSNSNYLKHSTNREQKCFQKPSLCAKHFFDVLIKNLYTYIPKTKVIIWTHIFFLHFINIFSNK